MGLAYTDTLLCTVYSQITGKELLYSTGKFSQYSVITYMGKTNGYICMDIQVCISDSLRCTPETNTPLNVKHTPIKCFKKWEKDIYVDVEFLITWFLRLLIHKAVLKVFLFVCFLFWLHLSHMEVPRPGIKAVPQQRPELLQRQCQILNPLPHSRNSFKNFKWK